VVKIFVGDCRRQEFGTSMLIRSAVGIFFARYAVIKRERRVHDSTNEISSFSEIYTYVCMVITFVTTLALAFPQINFSNRNSSLGSWCLWNCIVKFLHSRLLVLVSVLKQQDRRSVISTKPWFTLWRGKENCVKLDAEQLTSLWQLKEAIYLSITRT
jgi:uncharacterized membrane protein YhaH (DUF805 family)